MTLTTTAWQDGREIHVKYSLHHYTFELFALDTTVEVTPGADAWDTRTRVYAAMQDHVLGKAVYVGLFRRPQ